MTFRPLFELADQEALDRAALDRWFGPPQDMPPREHAAWYRWAKRARDASYFTIVL